MNQQDDFYAMKFRAEAAEAEAEKARAIVEELYQVIVDHGNREMKAHASTLLKANRFLWHSQEVEE